MSLDYFMYPGQIQLKYKLSDENMVSSDLITLFSPSNKIDYGGNGYTIYQFQKRLLRHKIETLHKSIERKNVFQLSEYDIKNKYFNIGFHENYMKLECHEEETAKIKIKANVSGKSYGRALPTLVFSFKVQDSTSYIIT